MIEVKDDLDRALSFQNPPQKIVSLVPSLSELIVDLGGLEKLVGVTKFCVHPLELRTKCKIIGGTKTVNSEKVKSLNPDLIIANKEENNKGQIENLCLTEKVYITDIQNVNQSLQTIQKFGIILNESKKADSILNCIKKTLTQTFFNDQKVLYLIWKNPWMSIGADTYIHDLIEHLGLKSITENLFRYPELSEKELSGLDPDIIMLSSEPFPFSQKHVQGVKSLFPNSKIILVDGEAFSWYGSRLMHLEKYFDQLK